MAHLFGQLSDKEELLFPRIEFDVEDKQYIADFVFFRNHNNSRQIVWLMHDLTQQYLHFSDIQRERNELSIKNRRLEFQQEINALQVELRYRQQIHQLQAEQLLRLSSLSDSSTFDFANTLWMLLHTVAQPGDKSLPLKLQIDKSIPPVLFGNQYGLCQVLYNVITTILRNTQRKELQVVVKNCKQQQEQVCLQFCLKDTDVSLPNYSQYLSVKNHISAQPLLPAANMPIYIAQTLLYDNGGNFEAVYNPNTQTYSYSLSMLFEAGWYWLFFYDLSI